MNGNERTEKKKTNKISSYHHLSATRYTKVGNTKYKTIQRDKKKMEYIVSNEVFFVLMLLFGPVTVLFIFLYVLQLHLPYPFTTYYLVYRFNKTCKTCFSLTTISVFFFFQFCYVFFFSCNFLLLFVVKCKYTGKVWANLLCLLKFFFWSCERFMGEVL